MPDAEGSQGRTRLAPTRAPGRVKEVSSVSNPIVKDIRALAQKKHRDETGLFLAEGLKLVVDALDAGWEIRTLVISRAASEGNDFLQQTAARAIALGADLVEANSKVLEAITRRDNPQSAVGIFRKSLSAIGKLALGDKADVVVALDRVRDPGNLGTIMRTADAAGAKGVILVGDTVDPFSLEAVRATMGSIFAVPLCRVGEAEFVEWRGRFRGAVVGTHMAGAVDYRTVAYGERPTVLLMGNEQTGLSETLAGACDTLVRIPQVGRADSLNLAVATGVMLFEARRGALVL